MFKEALAQLNPAPPFSLQIFATDLDREAIDEARQGVYPANIATDVSPERLQRFFTPEDRGGYRIAKEIREMVTLATQNLIMDPPFTKLDLLICRNVLIYLVPELQKKLLPLFHYSLNPGDAVSRFRRDRKQRHNAICPAGGRRKVLSAQRERRPARNDGVSHRLSGVARSSAATG